VIEFKRDVYQMALTELARFLPRGAQHNRYLRSGLRPHHRDDAPESYRRGEGSSSEGRTTFPRAGDAGLPTAPADLLEPPAKDMEPLTKDPNA